MTSSGPGKRHGFLAWCGVMTTAAILTLTGFELYLRYSATHVVPAAIRESGALVRRRSEVLTRQTPRGKRLIPGTHVVIQNHRLSRRNIHIDINSLGMRDEELPPAKPRTEWRVLVLGDSITWGDYLEAHEIYLKRAERRLRDRPLGGGVASVRVINAGAGDIGLREELDILEEGGLATQPDTVVVAFYLNDTRPPWGFSAETGSYGWLRRNSLLADSIYQNLLLRQWVGRVGKHRFAWIEAVETLPWRNDRQAFLELASLAKYDWGAAWDPTSWATVEALFGKLAGRARETGFDVAVLSFPVRYQVEAQFLEDGPQQALGSLARRFRFRYLDLLPILRAARGSGTLYFDHCHPTVLANDVIGEAFASFLAAEMLPLRADRRRP